MENLSSRIRGTFAAGAAAATLLLAFPQTLQATESLTLEQLPEAVRQTVERHKGEGTVGEIERDTKNGVAAYEVELQKQGRSFEFKVAEDGRVLGPDTTDRIENFLKSTGATITGKVTLDQVPEPVRKTIEAEMKQSGLRLDEIDRETNNERVYYEVELEGKGQERELRIGEDGTILATDEDDRPSTGTAHR